MIATIFTDEIDNRGSISMSANGSRLWMECDCGFDAEDIELNITESTELR